MWKLICYEARKLFSTKSGWLIFLLFVGANLWQIQADLTGFGIYDYSENAQHEIISKNVTNEVISEQKKLEGTYEELLRKKIPNKEFDTTHLNPNRELDNVQMELRYGKQWEQLSKAYEEHTLTQKMLDDYELDDGESYDLASFVMYYTYQDEERWNQEPYNTISKLLPSAGMMLDRSSYLYTKENQTGNDLCVLGACSEVSDTVTREEINRRFLSMSDTYHANLVGNAVVGTISYSNFIILIVMAMLFANVFSKETGNHTDIYLASSPMGGAHVVKAKLIFVLSIGILIPFLGKLITAGILVMQYGSFDWNMMYFDTYGYISNYLYTIKEMILSGLFNQVIGSFSLCVVTLFISQKCKNSYFAAILSLILVILPIYYQMYIRDGLDIARFFPSNLLMRFSENLSLETYFAGVQPLFFSIFGLVIPKLYAYWLFWIVLNTLLISWMIWEGKRHLVTTHA